MIALIKEVAVVVPTSVVPVQELMIDVTVTGMNNGVCHWTKEERQPNIVVPGPVELDKRSTEVNVFLVHQTPLKSVSIMMYPVITVSIPVKTTIIYQTAEELLRVLVENVGNVGWWKLHRLLVLISQILYAHHSAVVQT
jgi:hypothetical protein